MQCTYWDFFLLFKTVFELIDFDAFFSASAIFLASPLPRQENISLWGFFFHVGKQKMSLRAKSGE